MSGYVVTLVLHVLAAVLGMGLVSGVVIAGTVSAAPEAKVAIMKRLARGGGISLGIMLLTGIAIMATTRGAGGESWWLRGSILLLLAIGATLGMAQGALKGKDPAAAVERARTLSAVACVFLAAVVVLMQAKPF